MGFREGRGGGEGQHLRPEVEWAAGAVAGWQARGFRGDAVGSGDLSDQTLRPCNSSFGAIKVALKGYSSLRASRVQEERIGT